MKMKHAIEHNKLRSWKNIASRKEMSVSGSLVYPGTSKLLMA